MSSCSAVLLLLLQVFIGIWISTHARPGEILHGPDTHVTKTGTTVWFNCHIIGSPSWVINGAVTNPQAYGTFESKGFHFEDILPNQDYTEFYLTLRINVSLEVNDTSIQCQGTGSDNSPVRSQAAKLIIGTPPLPPAPEVQLINATALRLSWEHPFTWSEYPLLNYTVRMHNTSSGEEISWVRTIPAEVTTYDVFSRGRMISSSYHELVFSVMASSDLGESSQGIVRSGFPVVPGEFDASKITYEVSLQQYDGSLLLGINFESPQVCPSAWYRTTVTDNRGDIIISKIEHSLTSGVLVHEQITSNLSLNQNYSLSLVAETLAGSNTPFTLYFNTVFHLPNMCTTTAVTTTAHTARDDKTKDVTIIITAVVLGESVAVCILAIVIVGVICFCRRQRGHDKMNQDEELPKSVSPLAVSTIYDSPVYDTKQPKSQVKQVEGPQYDDIPPRLPPSRKKSVIKERVGEREKTAVSFSNELILPTGDEYTIMKPASVNMMPRRKESIAPLDPETDYVIIN